jgi:hypothetical protein
LWAALRAKARKLFSLRIAAVTILAFALLLISSTVQAQSPKNFTSSDTFSIPNLKGSLNFAFNGTYTSATLEGDTWTFTDLTLTNRNATRLGNLTISVKDSHITIFTFYSDRISNTFNRYGYIRYYADRSGEQTINLNINTTKPTHTSEWGVTNPPGVFLAPGQDWKLQSDNTIIVYGKTGNITVAHYGFNVDSDSDQPFYVQHSVALATLAVLGATVLAASLIRLSIRRKPSHGD